MLSAAQMDAHLAKMIADNATTFTFGADTFACEIGDLEQSLESELDGSLPSYDLVIMTRVALFTGTRPKRGDLVVQGGRTYRIDRDSVSGDQVELTLYCMAKKG